jgi:hypothetical protein
LRAAAQGAAVGPRGDGIEWSAGSAVGSSCRSTLDQAGAEALSVLQPQGATGGGHDDFADAAVSFCAEVAARNWRALTAPGWLDASRLIIPP